jgi:hypothetical protein
MLQYAQKSSTNAERTRRLEIPQPVKPSRDPPPSAFSSSGTSQRPPTATVYDVLSPNWMGSEAGGSSQGAGKIRVRLQYRQETRAMVRFHSLRSCLFRRSLTLIPPQSIPRDLTLASFVERVRFKLKGEYDLPIR